MYAKIQLLYSAKHVIGLLFYFLFLQRTSIYLLFDIAIYKARRLYVLYMYWPVTPRGKTVS